MGISQMKMKSDDLMIEILFALNLFFPLYFIYGLQMYLFAVFISMLIIVIYNTR